ncbi:WD40/YVTN/BNR-like repeat-containing protein [Roseivirga spongicola]|uniref:Glycosyl hydrolase n=1 Tax=Roseivirga spongicola TaxID=333140 RepID=A0A150X4L0_9BACT|nr:sialidase family protein [Roseivirga spongicola]KYG73666.1 glycosyl hydrolase [Roseivirga spongicola]WPZ09699.1 glycosyl hydrolase [Roseivirga spongicola]
MSEKNTLLVGSRKGLIVYRKNVSGKWRHDSTEFLGFPVTIACIDENTGYWWAMLDHGHWGCKIHRSKDGKEWEELEAPKYPEGEELKDGSPAATKYLWAFATGGKGQPGTIYVGTEPGGLFKSTNNGDSFELVRGLWDHPSRIEWFGGGRDNAGIHSILVDPADSNHIYVAVSCAGTFETLDGGESWKSVNKGLYAEFLPDPTADIGQDPHLVDWCAGNPKVMWQQNHCGIYRSVNGGEFWDKVSEENGPAHFGFAIAASETDTNVAWVVPGDSDQMRVAVDSALCVCRTDDGGKTWKAFREGLPQENVFDITYRHALDVTGSTLAFGTTTGNLYLSENDGESWATLSNNLPMVHSVEFCNT